MHDPYNGFEKNIKAATVVQSGNNPKAHVVNYVDLFMCIFHAKCALYFLALNKSLMGYENYCPSYRRSTHVL